MNFYELNQQNIELFKEYGISNIKSKIYKCVLCEKNTCLNEATSIKGAYLVCKCCVYNEFGSWEATRTWQNLMKKRFD